MRRGLLARGEPPGTSLVIGGGATGLGIAVDAAVARLLAPVLLERADFAKGTSSRSTKLVHGGVRYLAAGQHRPGAARPCASAACCAQRPAPRARPRLRRAGLRLVGGPLLRRRPQALRPARRHARLRPSRIALPRRDARATSPRCEPKGLRGGVVYHDGQFDDARLAIALARTADRPGGHAAQLRRASPGFLKDGRAGRRRPSVRRRRDRRDASAIRARVVVNATGVFADAIRRLDDPARQAMIAPSQGIHLVLDRASCPGDDRDHGPQDRRRPRALRHPLARPRRGRDHRHAGGRASPRAPPADGGDRFLLDHAGALPRARPRAAGHPQRLRRPPPAGRGTAAARPPPSRATTPCIVSPSGLVTITGGKWTTYRRMGEDAVDRAATVGGPAASPFAHRGLRLHGWSETTPRRTGPTPPTARILRARPPRRAPGAGTSRSTSNLPYRVCEVVWAARHEMARTVEDVLARRTRSLLLDARASAEVAPAVAALLAAELGRDEAWQRRQVAEYQELASGYWLEP